ncbi:MAG: hypothetical protein QNJ13_07840 [Paracoccaceae bacterium]|nr:hypothetical protein [Paracoccaceae bacterium]
MVCVRDVGRADLGGNARAHIVDELRRTAPAARILIVSSRKNAQDARGWIVAGAHGYLPAHSTPDLLTAAAVVVAAGGVFLPEELARSLSYPDA